MPSDNPFKWRQFEPGLILLCVRWYLRYAVSYRDLEEMMRERGLCVDHTTIYRWVQRYAPEIAFLVVVVIQLSVFALGVFRVWRTRTLVAMVLLGAVAYFLVVSGGPIGYSRFRHPMMPMICIFAGVGLVSERRSGHGPTRETFSTRSV